MSARILVVDDDEDIRNLIVFTLQNRGYAVIEASDGETALSLVPQAQLDLILLDVMLPGRTGLEVAKMLASDPATAQIPILMLSAKGQHAEIAQGLASGAKSYLVKPFTPRELATRVAEMLAPDALA